jgi:acetyl esterase/lipase
MTARRLTTARIAAAASLSALLLISACPSSTSERARAHSDGGEHPSRVDAGPPAAAIPFTVDSRIGDVLRHPVFQGYASLLLPWDDRSYDERMPLSEIGSLLPYHSHVDPQSVVQGLNRIIGDVSAGRKVFHAFYTEEEQQRDPAKRHAGLFFFRGKAGAPFAVVAPGGGFAYVGSVHEGFPYAVAISDAGYNAFVLKYRAGLGGSAATEDLAAALSFIMQNADTLSVARQSYSLWGSSAGARMAAAIGSHGVARFGRDALPKPAAVIMAYTGHEDATKSEPPTFVVVGEDDAIAPPETMARRVAALGAAGTPTEFRRYPNVGHGFGPGVDTSAEGWLGDAIDFWARFVAPAATDRSSTHGDATP